MHIYYIYTYIREWIPLLLFQRTTCLLLHYDDVIMTMLASQITSLMVVYSIVYSGVNERKHQSSASLAFVREIHRGPVNFPHKWPVTRKMFPFDDVIMGSQQLLGAHKCWKLLFGPSEKKIQNFYSTDWNLEWICKMSDIFPTSMFSKL